MRTIVIIFIFIFQYSQAIAQPPDSAVLIGKLENGFTYYIRKHDNPPRKAEMYLLVKAGRFNEEADQSEIAHLVEHMAFNGTKHYPGNTVTDFFKKEGITWNANTTEERTSFYFTLDKPRPELLDKGLVVLRDWAQGMTLDPAAIDQERNVILAEHIKSASEQGQLLKEIDARVLDDPKFPADPDAARITSMKSFSHASLLRFYKDWYRPDLEAVVIVGDIDVKETEKKIKALFSDMTMPANPRQPVSAAAIEKEYGLTLKGKNQFLTYKRSYFGSTTIDILLKKKSVPAVLRTPREMIKDRLFNWLLVTRTRGMTQRYNVPFTAVTFSFSRNALHSFAGIDLFKVWAELNNTPGAMEKGFGILLEALQQIKLYGFTAAELDAAKQLLLSEFRSGGDPSSIELVKRYADHFAGKGTDKDLDAESASNNIRSVTLEELNQLAKFWIDPAQNRTIIIKAPADQTNLPTEKMTTQWIKESIHKKPAQPLAAAEDITRLITDTVIFTKPTGNYTLTEMADMGMTKLTLANGIVVLMKPFRPAGFQSDKILLQGFKPGGLSLFSKDEQTAARDACAIVQHAGVADYDKFQIDRFLLPRGVKLSTAINSMTLIDGWCNKTEVTTLLEYLFLQLTRPRRDNAAFTDWQNRRALELATRQSEEGRKFNEFLFANSYRSDVSGATESDADPAIADLDAVYRIYIDRFVNTGDWTFVITGDFRTTELVPQLVKYLSPLPAGVKTQQVKPAPAERHSYRLARASKNLYLGNNEKAELHILFPAMRLPGFATKLKLELLGRVLYDRLWARLREKEGLIYGLDASASFSKGRDDVYAFSVHTFCATDKVDYLKAAVLEEFRKIRDEGIDEVSYKTALGKTRGNVFMTDLSRNRFWLEYISAKYVAGADLSEILKRETILTEIINREDLNGRLKEYMEEANMQSFIWLPERLKPAH